MQLALIFELCIHGFNQPRIENIGKNFFPESFKKQNLNLLCQHLFI